MGSKFYCLTAEQCCGNHRYAEIEITDDSIIIKDRMDNKILYRKEIINKILPNIIAENSFPIGISSRIFLNQSEIDQAIAFLADEFNI